MSVSSPHHSLPILRTLEFQDFSRGDQEEYPKEAKETRVASDDFTDRTSDVIQVRNQVREGSEAVLLFDEVNANISLSEVWEDSVETLPLDEAIVRSDQKEFKETRAASDDSAAPTSNYFQVEEKEGFEAGLLLNDVNVNDSVLEVREDSEAAPVLGVTDDVREDGNVQVDNGCDDLIENEQKGFEEELSELDTRMETMTKKKVHFQTPLHENASKRKRSDFFSKKDMINRSLSVSDRISSVLLLGLIV